MYISSKNAHPIGTEGGYSFGTYGLHRRLELRERAEHLERGHSRQVLLCLTPQAKALREEAEDIPSLFSCKLRDAGCAEGELSALREQLDHLISRLEEKSEGISSASSRKAFA